VGQKLGERLLLDSATMTGLLDRLEHAGLIERQSHATDRRVKPCDSDGSAGAKLQGRLDQEMDQLNQEFSWFSFLLKKQSSWRELLTSIAQWKATERGAMLRNDSREGARNIPGQREEPEVCLRIHRISSMEGVVVWSLKQKLR